MQVSLAMEGRLTCDGLQSMEDDEDVLTAMARELVTRHGVGEAAAAVWASLQIDRKSAMPELVEPPAQPHGVPAEAMTEEATWIRSDGPAVQLSLF
jgi:hypothetical protein